MESMTRSRPLPIAAATAATAATTSAATPAVTSECHYDDAAAANNNDNNDKNHSNFDISDDQGCVGCCVFVAVLVGVVVDIFGAVPRPCM